MAKSEHDEAVKDAALELKIADTVKSVGDTSIDADAASRVASTDSNRVHTGLQDNDTASHADGRRRVRGQTLYHQWPDDTEAPDAYVAPTAGAEGTYVHPR